MFVSIPNYYAQFNDEVDTRRPNQTNLNSNITKYRWTKLIRMRSKTVRVCLKVRFLLFVII